MIVIGPVGRDCSRRRVDAVISFTVTGRRRWRRRRRGPGDIDFLPDLDQVRILYLLIGVQQILQADSKVRRDLRQRIAWLNFVDIGDGWHLRSSFQYSIVFSKTHAQKERDALVRVVVLFVARPTGLALI